MFFIYLRRSITFGEGMQSIITIGDHFKKWKVSIFYLLSLLIILGNVNDLFITNIKWDYFKRYTLYVSLLIATITLISFLLFKYNLRIGFAILLYSSFINLLLTQQLNQDFFEAYFLRELIFIVAVILVSGIFISKTHIIIQGLIYCIYFFFMIGITSNMFLKENAITLVVTFISFISFSYYLFYKLEKNFLIQRDLIDQLNEKQTELKELNSSKDRLFSILGHDLRSPLNTILGYNEIVKDKLQANKAKDALQFLSVIESSTLHTQQLLDNLLLWSYSQTGKTKLFPEEFNFSQILNQTLRIFSNEVKSKKLLVQSKFNDELIVFADSNMIATVLRNLISNAIKFSPINEAIIIEAFIEKKNLIFTIQDYGAGIPQKYLESIFNFDNPFTTSGTNDEKGTGFGLSICMEFIKKHEGTIEVNSEVSKGSTFKISLPTNVNKNIIEKKVEFQNN